MEIKKCKNCGEFIMSENNICTSCLNKLNYGKTVLKSYFEDTNSCNSISSISSSTGVAPSIIQNYLNENNIDIPINDTDFYNSLPY